MGENRQGEWTQETEYTTPQITAPATTGWTKGTIADYMGIPTGKTNFSVSALPFRGYIKIYNEFMRNQNIVAPLLEMFDDTTVAGDNASAVYGGAPCRAMKFRDYFTSCLPEPQKGDSITLPLGSQATVKLVDGLVNPTTGKYTYGTEVGKRQLTHRDTIYSGTPTFNLDTTATTNNGYTGTLGTNDTPSDRIIIKPIVP